MQLLLGSTVDTFLPVYGGVSEEFTVCLRERGPRILRSSQRPLWNEFTCVFLREKWTRIAVRTWKPGHYLMSASSGGFFGSPR